MKKHRLSLTSQEWMFLTNILHHFSDYIAMDERFDHGMGRLKDWRTMDYESKAVIHALAARMIRIQRNRVKE